MGKDIYVDPTANVHPDAIINSGAKIWNWSKVREGANIGQDTTIGQNTYIDIDVKIGARSKIQNGVSIYNGVTIENDVFVGPNATFTNDLSPRAHNEEWQTVPTLIKNGASIGANATILCGLTLHDHCMVAAGAVVTTDVPAHALVMGCPARIVGYVTISGKRIYNSADQDIDDISFLKDKKLDV